MNKQALDFFRTAETYVKANFNDELIRTETRKFENQTDNDLLEQYIHVVLASGFSYDRAKLIYQQFQKNSSNPNSINHPLKKKAIIEAQHHYKEWFRGLHAANDKIGFIDRLPMMGSITKYHLSRNLGIDCAKPDRHLQRLSDRFGYHEVNSMCQELAQEIGYRIGTVDVILWRYCKEHPGY